MKWAVLGSNQRPPACRAGALPTELTARVRAASRPPQGVEDSEPQAADRRRQVGPLGGAVAAHQPCARIVISNVSRSCGAAPSRAPT